MKFCKLLLSSCTADGELPVMRLPLFSMLYLSTLFFSQNLIATLTPGPGSYNSAPGARALTIASVNSTLSYPQLPPGFDLSYEIGGPKLRTTSCLMNTVAALKEIALGEPDAKIIDGTEYKLDSYPEVSIIVTAAKRNHNIRARYVAWAINYGVYEMIATKKFEFAQFEISWLSQMLGWLQVINHSPSQDSKTNKRQTYRALDLGNYSATLPSANQPVNITKVLTTDNADDPEEARLTVEFEPYGAKLGLFDVFVPIMSCLTDMGKIPNSYEAEALMVGMQGYRGFICFLPDVPSRTTPPLLTYGWLKRAVARIPAYMLGQARFGEVMIKVDVDGVRVGFGRFSTSPVCNRAVLISAS